MISLQKRRLRGDNGSILQVSKESFRRSGLVLFYLGGTTRTGGSKLQGNIFRLDITIPDNKNCQPVE